MTKITYNYPNDGLTVKAVHASHQETLYIELLFPLIEQQAQSDSSGGGLFGNIAGNWAKQELSVLGFCVDLPFMGETVTRVIS